MEMIKRKEQMMQRGGTHANFDRAYDSMGGSSDMEANYDSIEEEEDNARYIAE